MLLRDTGDGHKLVLQVMSVGGSMKGVERNLTLSWETVRSVSNLRSEWVSGDETKRETSMVVTLSKGVQCKKG